MLGWLVDQLRRRLGVDGCNTIVVLWCFGGVWGVGRWLGVVLRCLEARLCVCWQLRCVVVYQGGATSLGSCRCGADCALATAVAVGVVCVVCVRGYCWLAVSWGI
jgi:hypothetical protein